MSPELTDKLTKDFNFTWEVNYGIECDDGWEPLLRDLCGDVCAILDDASLTHQSFVVSQIKEKFGGLRFHYYLHIPEVTDGYKLDDQIHEKIKEAEARSWKTCEVCGVPAILCTTGYWTKVLCPDHREGTKYEPYVRSWP